MLHGRRGNILRYTSTAVLEYEHSTTRYAHLLIRELEDSKDTACVLALG